MQVGTQQITSQTGRSPLILVENYGIHGALITLGSDQLVKNVIAPNDYVVTKSPSELPNDNLIFLSKDSSKNMTHFAAEFIILNQVNDPNAHIAGLHIYYLEDMRPALRRHCRELRKISWEH